MKKRMGLLLIVLGVVLLVVGLFFYFNINIPFLGKLPGDIFIKRDNFSFYFPITTSILISALISLILFVISRFR